ncbi:MAG: glycosyltransferase [Lacibacter sp.]
MIYWLLTTEFPPFYGGGIGTYCFHTAAMLAENKHAVSVFASDTKLNNRVEIKKDYNYRVIRFNPFLVCNYKELGYQARVNYAFALVVGEFLRNEGKPDYVEAQDYLGIGYYVQQFKLLKYPHFEHLSILITLHSPAFIYLEHNKVSTFKYPDYWTCEMEKQSILAADVLISPSAFMAEEIKKYLPTVSTIQVIPNPFTYTFLKELPAVQKNAFTFLGKLSRQKGIFHLLLQMENIWKQNNEIKLTLIGSPDIVYHPELKTGGDIIKKKYRAFIKNNNLTIAGKASPLQIETLLKHSEAIIIPSIIDNLPYAVLEAMAQGKIVIANANGGQAEIITNEINGFLFSYNDENALGHVIHKVQALSEAEYETICKNAKQRIKTEYSYETVYTQKIKLLKEYSAPVKNQFPFNYQYSNNPSEIQNDGNEILSVVIPFFNMSATIDETIASVLKSSWQATEIILVNDGSTENNSIAKIEQYRKHPQIKVIDTENKGLSSARNTGALAATGCYLAFLDADDKVASDYYEKAISVLKAYDNVYFVGAWTKYFEDSTGMWPTVHPTAPLITYHNTINSSALVYKKESFLASGMNDTELKDGLEDYESVIHLLSNGYNGVVLPELLFLYRVRKNSMFRKLTLTKKKNALEYIATKHSHFYSKFAAELFKLQIQNGPGYYFDNTCIEYKTNFTVSTNNYIFQIGRNIANRFPFLKKAGLTVYKRFKNY